jgi:hypothetical protein
MDGPQRMAGKHGDICRAGALRAPAHRGHLASSTIGSAHGEAAAPMPGEKAAIDRWPESPLGANESYPGWFRPPLKASHLVLSLRTFALSRRLFMLTETLDERDFA